MCTSTPSLARLAAPRARPAQAVVPRVATGPGWELRLGNCLDYRTGLASLGRVDHFIQDPPFTARTHDNIRSARMSGDDRGASSGADVRRKVEIGFQPISPLEMWGIAMHASDLVRRWVLTFCEFEQADLWRSVFEGYGLKHWREGCWRKKNPTPAFNGRGPAQWGECIEIVCRKSGWNGGGRDACWEHTTVISRSAREKRTHETQKPLELMEALVRDFTDRDEVIVDPFAGSGTTGVAALRLGRRFIGWERDEATWRGAVERLRGTREQRQIFDVTPKGKRTRDKPSALPGAEGW